MAEVLTFTVTFHSPFRVATGDAARGLDATIDTDDPLPGSSLKGLMRDTALAVLVAPEALVDEVFGTPGRESAWVWAGARPRDGQRWPATSIQTRVAIDEQTHTVTEDLINVGEILEPGQAEFDIKRVGPVSDAAVHATLLCCSAAAVHHVGADRTRGLGWVTISPPAPVSADDLRAIREWDVP